MIREATMSSCQKFRYQLWRIWGPDPHALFIGLNPSTADASLDDPTIRRCTHFTNRLGLRRFGMGNLFAFKSTDPRFLSIRSRKGLEIIGPDNDMMLGDMISKADVIIPCWGALGGLDNRDRKVMAMIKRRAKPGVVPLCLTTTLGGFPRHPLYLRNSTSMVEYKGR